MNTSEINLKQLFGKVLGEIYRLRSTLDPDDYSVSESTIFGLTRGIETVIDEEIERTGWISKEQFEAVCDVLDQYSVGDVEQGKVRGFYDIEPSLNARGVDRPTAMIAITYLKADNRFTEIIEKFNSMHSPVECKRFDIY
jgi:hypothetical protein